MHTRVQCGGQPNIARHHQDQPPSPADAREIATQTSAIGVVVMTVHDTGETWWQPGDGGARVRQSSRVREQPERRDSNDSAG